MRFLKGSVEWAGHLLCFCSFLFHDHNLRAQIHSEHKDSDRSCVSQWLSDRLVVWAQMGECDTQRVREGQRTAEQRSSFQLLPRKSALKSGLRSQVPSSSPTFPTLQFDISFLQNSALKIQQK